MVVWSGRGVLSIIVLVVVFGLSVSILPTESQDWSFVITSLVTGVFSWIFGKKWNEKEGQTVIDKATGQEMILKPNHSLFWIKMQYWGIIFGVLSIVFLVQQFI